MKKANKIAGFAGRMFAVYMFLEGFLNIFGIVLAIYGGLWFMLLGGFLYFIAGMSYEQILIKSILEKIPIKSLKLKKLLTIKSSLKVSEFIKKYTNEGENIFLIEKENKIINIEDIYQNKDNIGKLAKPVINSQCVKINDSAYSAFNKMSQNRSEGVLVLEKNKVAGILTKSILVNRLYWESKFIDNKKIKRK